MSVRECAAAEQGSGVEPLHLIEAELDGVSRPKIDTSTVSFCVAGSTSETTADIDVNGPSVTVT